MEITATATSTYADEGMYDSDFFDEIIRDYDTSYNSEDAPLIINNAGELAAFAKAVNEGGKTFSEKFIKLGASIDLGGTPPTIEKVPDGDNFKIKISGTATKVWKPIANSNKNFRGTFDGDGKEIKNMIVLENWHAGFFGYTNALMIKNLGITGKSVVISSAGFAGSLIGYSNRGYTGGSISNCWGTANVYAYSNYNGSASAGGLIGMIYTSDIKQCYATGDIYAFGHSSGNGAEAGGLLGYSQGGGVRDSYGTGNVYASSLSSSYSTYAGGLIGACTDYGANISNNYAVGNAFACSTFNSYSGGLSGYIGPSYTVSSCYRFSGATVVAKKGDANGTIGEEGTPLSREEMTGTGAGRADEKMPELRDATDSASQKIWTFTEDATEKTEEEIIHTFYLPRLSTINYAPGSEPKFTEVEYFLTKFIDADIAGNMAEGKELLAQVIPKDPATNIDDLQLKYAWSADGVPIDGATQEMYTLKAEDVDKKIQLTVTSDKYLGEVTALKEKETLPPSPPAEDTTPDSTQDNSDGSGDVQSPGEPANLKEPNELGNVIKTSDNSQNIMVLSCLLMAFSGLAVLKEKENLKSLFRSKKFK